MTINQADAIADRIKSLPRLYDAPPTLTEGMRFDFLIDSKFYYPWIKTSSFPFTYRAAYSGRANNLYDVHSGFEQQNYSSTIRAWKATDTDTVKGRPRYITIDDLRMMAYVGIEYARAKLEGWRYRYGELGEEATLFPPRCIVRLKDGKRFIHRTSSAGNITAPPGSGGPNSDVTKSYYSYKFWTPMTRMPGFEEPKSGGFDYPEEFEIPSEAFNGIVQLGTIVGNDDLVKFGVERTTLSFAVGGDVLQPCVESGSMEIILSTANFISENDLENCLTVFQQNSYPVYYVWDSRDLYRQGNAPMRITTAPNRYSEFYTFATIDSQGSFVPLKKGVTYNVFARFSDAVLKKYEGKKLVTYSRTATKTQAPYVGDADTWGTSQDLNE